MVKHGGKIMVKEVTSHGLMIGETIHGKKGLIGDV